MEASMTVLKSLTFTTLPRPGANPTLDRRLRVIERLEEQKRLVVDPNYKRTIRTSVRKDGVKSVVETQHRVMPWWRITGNGTFVFFVRTSQKIIEFNSTFLPCHLQDVPKRRHDCIFARRRQVRSTFRNGIHELREIPRLD